MMSKLCTNPNARDAREEPALVIVRGELLCALCYLETEEGLDRAELEREAAGLPVANQIPA